MSATRFIVHGGLHGAASALIEERPAASKYGVAHLATLPQEASIASEDLTETFIVGTFVLLHHR